LAEIVVVWPKLPGEFREELLALIRALGSPKQT